MKYSIWKWKTHEALIYLGEVDNNSCLMQKITVDKNIPAMLGAGFKVEP